MVGLYIGGPYTTYDRFHGIAVLGAVSVWEDHVAREGGADDVE